MKQLKLLQKIKQLKVLKAITKILKLHYYSKLSFGWAIRFLRQMFEYVPRT